MEQRRVRLGDIVDDYCPRERRVTDHAVVAMIEDEVRQTRCTACDADHPYKAGKVPRAKKKDGAALPVPPSTPFEDQAGSSVDQGDAVELPAEGPSSLGATRDGGGAEPAPSGDRPAAILDAREEGPFRRSLIRATLPRPEGQPTTRPLPEFTMRQSGVRGGRLIDNGPRGTQRPGPAGGSSRPKPERHGTRPEHRHGHSRSGASRFDRPHGHGRGGGGHRRPGRGKKRSR